MTDQEQKPILLAPALIAAQAEFPEIKLDATVKVRTKSGGEYEFRYATLGNIITTIRPILSKHKLAVSQVFSGHNLKTLILHEGGETLCSDIALPFHEGMSNQDRGAVITYFRRYALSAVLNLCTEADTDGNTPEVGNVRVAKDPTPVTRHLSQSKSPDWARPEEPSGKAENATHANTASHSASGATLDEAGKRAAIEKMCVDLSAYNWHDITSASAVMAAITEGDYEKDGEKKHFPGYKDAAKITSKSLNLTYAKIKAAWDAEMPQAVRDANEPADKLDMDPA